MSNDVSRLGVNEGVYATYLTPNGRMLTDLDIFRRPGFWLLGLEQERAAPIADRLDQSIFSEDVRVANATSELDETIVVGGDAASRLAAALALPAGGLETLPELGQIDRKDGFVARLGDSRLPMYACVAPAGRRHDVIDRLEASGIAPVSPLLIDALRIEAGRPRFGADMTEETIPLEAGLLDRAISTTKGCYVGQEIVIRVLHRGGGRVARRLVTLSFDPPSGTPFLPGTPLIDAERTVGQLTSVSSSPTSAQMIGLGYLHRDVAEKGRQVTVGETGVAATVTGFAG